MSSIILYLMLPSFGDLLTIETLFKSPFTPSIIKCPKETVQLTTTAEVYLNVASLSTCPPDSSSLLISEIIGEAESILGHHTTYTTRVGGIDQLHLHYRGPFYIIRFTFRLGSGAEKFFFFFGSPYPYVPRGGFGEFGSVITFIGNSYGAHSTYPVDPTNLKMTITDMNARATSWDTAIIATYP